jgi:asparagine synthase (glutamine-hydrolysing)
VAADVRLDNALELAEELKVPAGVEASELVLEAFLRWDERFAEHLTGDYAVVVRDARNRRLIAARDPFGVRPLVYRLGPDRTWVASGVSQLLATIEGRPALDDDAVVEHLIWRERATDGTCFREIRQIRPGHTVVFRNGSMSAFRHWYPPTELVRLPRTADYHEEFRRLFRVAVARRLRSDRPVLVQVSGGIDSSSIACMIDLIQREGALPCPTVRGVSALYPGLACDESPYIDAVAAQVGFPIEGWDAAVAEPIDLTNPSPVMPGGRVGSAGGSLGDVEIAHRSHSRVIMRGLGGDQLGFSAGIVLDLLRSGQWSFALGRFLDFPEVTLRLLGLRALTVAKQLLPPGVRGAIAQARVRLPRWLTTMAHLRARRIWWPRAPGVSFVATVQKRRWDLLWSQQIARALTTDDLVGRVNGVEFRYPFLDIDLVRFVLSIPAEHWPRLAPSARLQREAMRHVLPPTVAGRTHKPDFTPGLANRLARASGQIRELLFGARWDSERYVRQPEAQALCRDVLESSRQVGSLQYRHLWNIALLEAWLRGGLR